MKVAVRSYKRSESILKKTLGALLMQKDLDLGNNLVLAVADQEEYNLYKEVLKDYPIKDIIITGIGGHIATNALIDYFPEGEQIIFMDDDISKIQCYTDIMDSKSRFDVTNLDEIFKYAFSKFEDCPFGIDFTPNLMFKQGKPFAEFKMRKIGGAWWGAYNSKELLKTMQSHEDDNIRTAKALSHFGGVGVINWLTAVSAVGLNKGGLQASGDRGIDDRNEVTKLACYRAQAEHPEILKWYQKEPVFIESMDFWSLRLKNIRELRKLNPLNTETRWSAYMQQKPDAQINDTNLEDFF